MDFYIQQIFFQIDISQFISNENESPDFTVYYLIYDKDCNIHEIAGRQVYEKKLGAQKWLNILLKSWRAHLR